MKNFLILLALTIVIVVLGLFLKPSKLVTPTGTSTPLSFEPSLTLPDLAHAGVEAQAWGNFQDYLKAARSHDLTALKKFSYQLSPTCADSAQEKQCFELMDSLVLTAGGFEQRDFSNIAYDDKQVVMSTEYMKLAEPTKVVIYFVRAEDKFPKMLGIRFCYGDEAKSETKCVNTDPTTRDSDKNGWWDDVETLFYKAS